MRNRQGDGSFFASFVGFFLADSMNLVKPFRFEKDILKKTVPAIVVLGLLFACDYFIFGNLIPQVMADYEKGISLAYILLAKLF